MDDKVVPFPGRKLSLVEPRKPVPGELGPPEELIAGIPGEPDIDTTTILEHAAMKARSGHISGCLMVSFDPASNRFEHAFCATRDSDASANALQLLGYLEIVRHDLLQFTRTHADYEPLDPKELA